MSFLCFSESEKALSCFLDASSNLLVDNFLITLMNHVSKDSDARHLEVLYYLQVQQQQLRPQVSSLTDHLTIRFILGLS